MTKVNKDKKSNPFPIRLTELERERLEQLAGSQPLGSYIKSVVFDGGTRRRVPRRPVRDQANLARILAMIGHSNLAQRLDCLVEAIESGSLLVDDDTTETIQSACAEVHAMHGLLMKALGFQEDRP